jgi:hypothetical protein
MSAHAGPSTLRRPVVPRDDELELLSLAARLTLEDAESFEGHQNREGRTLTDGELALRLAAEEARLSVLFNNDRALAQRLHDADQHLFGTAMARNDGLEQRQIRNAMTFQWVLWSGFLACQLNTLLQPTDADAPPA